MYMYQMELSSSTSAMTTTATISSPSSSSASRENNNYIMMMKEYYLQTWKAGGGLHRVMCMQGGDDDGSYAKNSEAPASAITICKPLLLTAIQSIKLIFNTKSTSTSTASELSDHDYDYCSTRIADLGCATGHNTLATVDMIVGSLRKRYLNECGIEDPEFEVFFSDLPSNDFNSLFQSLTLNDINNSKYYAAGVPGSFYRRLFPKSKLHISISLSALHWLSQIPEVVLDKTSPAWNKGRAWIEGASKQVVEAYAEQSDKDLHDFLRCRKQEIAKGGLLFILMGGRQGSQPPDNQLGDDADSRAKHPFTTSMDQAWQDLLDEGLIDEETRDTFNIPAYMRSTEEVESAIRKCGGFEITKMEYRRIVEHSEEKQQEWIVDPVSYGRAEANMVRATLRPIVEAHIGPYLSDQFFNRFQTRVSSDFNLLRKTCFYGVIIVCALRI